jgi:hypothetical protein
MWVITACVLYTEHRKTVGRAIQKEKICLGEMRMISILMLG